MATAGYSGTPLPNKLGIRDGHVVALVDAPDHLRDIAVDDDWSGLKLMVRKELRS